METLAYLHLALTYEETETASPVRISSSLRGWSSQIALQLLSISALIALSSSASYATALQIGASGPEVLALQERLQALGYFDLCPTGYFGEATQEAALRFQHDRGLNADGVVGSQTQAVLASVASSSARTPQATSSPSPFSQDSFTSTTGTPSPTPNSFTSSPRTPSPTPNSFTRSTGTPSPTPTVQSQNFEEKSSISSGRTFDTRSFTSSTSSPTPPPTNEPSASENIASPQETMRSSASETENFRRTLRRGDRAPEVGTLQNALRGAGFYQGATTGDFDAATEAAVIQFQQAYGLGADGIYGLQTHNALQTQNLSSGSNLSTSSSSLRRGDSGEAVTQLQQALTASGFYSGPVTGYFGSMTEAALMDFQQAKGIHTDGIVGTATQSALLNYSSSSVPQTYSSSPAPQTYSSSPVPQTYSSSPVPQAYYSGLQVNEEFTVLQLQQRLQARGLYGGLLDGIEGPQTQAAVEAAQERYMVSESEIRSGHF